MSVYIPILSSHTHTHNTHKINAILNLKKNNNNNLKQTETFGKAEPPPSRTITQRAVSN